MKKLFSQNFCNTLVALRFCNFPTVYMCVNWKIFRETNSQLLKLWKSTMKHDNDFFGKINISSVKSTSLPKKLLKSWFHEFFFFLSDLTEFLSDKLSRFHIILELWNTGILQTLILVFGIEFNTSFRYRYWYMEALLAAYIGSNFFFQ